MDERIPHPILPNPCGYDVVHIDWRLEPQDTRNSRIDLILRNDGGTRRLRFFSPRNVKIDEGFSGRWAGLAIYDVKARQWEGIGVEVANLEQDPGISFLAAEVVDLDQRTPSSL